MLDYSKIILYTTEDDTCFIGCGTPLIFLTWVPRNQALFFCPSCEGIWDQDLFLSSNPKLYSTHEFGKDTLTPSTESEILKTWQGRIIVPEDKDENYYLEELFKVFGRRLFFRTENRAREEI